MAKREIKTKVTEEVKVEQTEPSVDVKVNEEPVAKVEDNKETCSICKGIVIGCRRLNIRRKPNKDASIALVVEANSELKIVDVEKSTGDWYKVITGNKVHGYCMKKYVQLV